MTETCIPQRLSQAGGAAMRCLVAVAMAAAFVPSSAFAASEEADGTDASGAGSAGAGASTLGTLAADGYTYVLSEIPDGTYIGTATSETDDVRWTTYSVSVEVTVEGGAITAIEVDDSTVSAVNLIYFEDAIGVCDQIIAANSTDGIDAVSGATVTSTAIVDAVNEVLQAVYDGTYVEPATGLDALVDAGTQTSFYVTYEGTGTYEGMTRIPYAVGHYFGYQVDTAKTDDGYDIIVYFGGSTGYSEYIDSIYVYDTLADSIALEGGTEIAQAEADGYDDPVYTIGVDSLNDPVYCSLYVGGSMSMTVTYTMTLGLDEVTDADYEGAYEASTSEAAGFYYDLGKIADGTYTGTATVETDYPDDWDSYDITATVTVEGGAITAVEVDESAVPEESELYFSRAYSGYTSRSTSYEGVPSQVTSTNGTTGVDAVSGATLSSDAILDAVDAALQAAYVDQNVSRVYTTTAALMKSDGVTASAAAGYFNDEATVFENADGTFTVLYSNTEEGQGYIQSTTSSTADVTAERNGYYAVTVDELVSDGAAQLIELDFDLLIGTMSMSQTGYLLVNASLGEAYEQDVAWSVDDDSYNTSGMESVAVSMIESYFGTTVSIDALADGSYNVLLGFNGASGYTSAIEGVYYYADGDLTNDDGALLVGPSYAGEKATFAINVESLAASYALSIVIGGSMGGMFSPGADILMTLSADLSSAELALSAASYTYNGAAQVPDVTVTLDGEELAAGSDYTVAYSDDASTDAGTYAVTVTGAGAYTGSLSASYTIKAKSISSATVALSYSSTAYSGSAKKPLKSVKLKVGGTTKRLAKGTDYTVSYSANKAIGKATVKVSGKGNYTGTISKTFKIVPKKVTLKSSTKSSAKKKITVKWAKAKGSVTKYQVRYRVKGTSKWTVKTVGASKASVTLTKLKSGKKYQVQVRAYKTVKGTKYYGAWSAAKTVKAK